MVGVTYRCPRCGAVAELDRDGYLADRSVTADPLEAWEYAAAYDSFQDADGVVIVCGASETDGEGCSEPYYLNFVKYEDGEPLTPERPVVDARFDFRT